MRNIDRGEWAAQYPDTALVKLGGRSFYVLHNLKELDLDPAAAGIDVVVSGHSHIDPLMAAFNAIAHYGAPLVAQPSIMWI